MHKKIEYKLKINLRPGATDCLRTWQAWPPSAACRILSDIYSTPPMPQASSIFPLADSARVRRWRSWRGGAPPCGAPPLGGPPRPPTGPSPPPAARGAPFAPVFRAASTCAEKPTSTAARHADLQPS